jgi:hypothetical protein
MRTENRRRLRALPLACLPVLLAGCLVAERLWPGEASAQAPAKKDGGRPAAKAVVPFSMLPSNHMLVRAMINGKGPYRLIFDLGAPITLLSNEAGEASGVVKPEGRRGFLFSMRGEAEVAKLQVGGLTAEKLPVIVFDHPALKALGQAFGRRIDGIIGFTFFARYRTTIDYQVNEMTFEPVDFRMRDLLKELPDRLAGPKTARQRILAPSGLWGLRLGPPRGGIDAPGVPVEAVLPGSAAEVAGLKTGDVLTTLDGRWTTSIADVYAAAAGAEPGRDVPVEVLREKKELTLTVHPADGA